MDPKFLHKAAGELFRRALELDPEEREEFLRTEEGALPDVLREARSLLDHHAEDSFLDGPKLERGKEFPPASALPERIGPYRIEKLLGWGGAGIVYRAIQARPHRRVALKLMRSQVVEAEALARFRRESELLAQLDHPGIPRVVESGELETPMGLQAFIAMEYVEGRPLLEYALERPHRERIHLGVELARVVEHAHRQGIVHRDLKPANLMVRPGGQPLLLDFGIARRLGEVPDGRADWTQFAGETVTGQLLGTLAYMSPEQAIGDAGAIDERSDVYALGVILFELVTGKLPYDTRDKLITEAIRTIERGDPTPLSHYGRAFSGDLETIVEKAMRKEPARRYATAKEFADDLQRYLEDRPIEARPPSAAYRTRKFLVRHRRASFSAMGVILLLVTALASSLSSLQAAHEAESAVRIERAGAIRLADRLLLEKLEAEADELWPARPEELPRFDAWLRLAERLVESREVHARDAAGSELSPDDPDELEQLKEFVAQLDRFVDSGGPLRSVRERYAFAANLEARTMSAFEREWAEACEAIADEVRSPLYRGLRLEPQLGLVPIGPDPDSGLWEFSAFGPTGARPQRDPETGRLKLEADTGLVLVLIPGGEFLFGAQADDPAAPNFDPETRDHEGPPEHIELAPFFLGKVEWTQAQWLRITGSNPSYYADGDSVGDTHFTSLSPVEGANWTECMDVLGKLALTLPTETQWEYACRAGTSSVYWSGDDLESLLASSNLKDKPSDHARIGFQMHAPVGSLRPNGFGLHDMTGNVSELCLDVFKVDCREWPLREGDGLRLTPDGPERVRRGGAWASRPEVARSARRDDQLYYMGSATIGFRAARPLDR